MSENIGLSAVYFHAMQDLPSLRGVCGVSKLRPAVVCGVTVAACGPRGPRLLGGATWVQWCVHCSRPAL